MLLVLCHGERLGFCLGVECRCVAVPQPGRGTRTARAVDWQLTFDCTRRERAFGHEHILRQSPVHDGMGSPLSALRDGGPALQGRSASHLARLGREFPGEHTSARSIHPTHQAAKSPASEKLLDLASPQARRIRRRQARSPSRFMKHDPVAQNAWSTPPSTVAAFTLSTSESANDLRNQRLNNTGAAAARRVARRRGTGQRNCMHSSRPPRSKPTERDGDLPSRKGVSRAADGFRERSSGTGRQGRTDASLNGGTQQSEGRCASQRAPYQSSLSERFLSKLRI